MKNVNKIILLLLFIVLMMGCHQEEHPPTTISEFKSWFLKEDHGFMKKRCVNDLCINVQYKPKVLMAVNEIKMLSVLTNNKVDSVVKTYDGSEYFMMEISHKGSNSKDPLRMEGGNLDSYGELSQDLAFHINNKLQLIKNEKDTLYPSISHLEQGYELSGTKKIIIAFPGKFNEDDKISFIYDDEIFGVGRMKYQFDMDKKTIPTIPIN